MKEYSQGYEKDQPVLAVLVLFLLDFSSHTVEKYGPILLFPSHHLFHSIGRGWGKKEVP